MAHCNLYTFNDSENGKIMNRTLYQIFIRGMQILLSILGTAFDQSFFFLGMIMHDIFVVMNKQRSFGGHG